MWGCPRELGFGFHMVSFVPHRIPNNLANYCSTQLRLYKKLWLGQKPAVLPPEGWPYEDEWAKIVRRLMGKTARSIAIPRGTTLTPFLSGIRTRGGALAFMPKAMVL